MTILIYGMVFLGSALMVYNIYAYTQYLRNLLKKDYWESGRGMLFFPLILLIGFLLGYVTVGIFGNPDIIMSGILFFGSVYVTMITTVLKRITQRVEENERLQSELRAAEEGSKAKTRFLSHMSHEIRTPMNAIVGLNTLAMRNPDLPKETREQLEKVDASARHMLDLLNDILNMSQIESGHVELKVEPFSMRGLMDQVNNIIEAQCDEKGLTYEFKQLGRTEEWYLGDVMKLRQILINILGNAVKFTPQGGTVQMHVMAVNHDTKQCPLRFTIRDTGEGMDEAYLHRIFEAFSQEDETSTNRHGGSGLGMAITKSLVDLMGGQIRAESEKGKGTTFTVDITLEQAQKDTPQSEEAAEAYAARPADAVEEVIKKETARAAEAAMDAAADAKIPAAEPEEKAPAETAKTAPAPEAPAAAAAPAAGESSLEGKHILFAEDIEINAEILSDLLEMEDMTSDWAMDGQVAVDMFARSEPGTYDAILMDLRMPVMDGLAATRHIRELDREDASKIPIIALTANAFEEDVKQCMDAGMNAHLPKPVDFDLLCAKLHELIG